MKKFIASIFFLSLGFTIAYAEEIVVTELKTGSLGVKAPGAKTYRSAKVGDKIAVGSWIMTLEDTDATLTFYKTNQKTGDVNSSLDIGSFTKIKIESFDAKAEKVKTEIKQRVGNIVSTVNPKESKGSDYRVQTPQITAAVKGTITQNVATSEGTDQSTLRGNVNVDTGSGEFSVGAGQQTDDQGTPSIDSLLANARQTPTFSGASGAETASQQSNGTAADGPASNQNESGGANVTGLLQNNLTDADPNSGSNNSSSSDDNN